MHNDYLTFDERAARQKEGLLRAVAHAYNNSPFYRRVFDEAGLTPDQIREPADFIKVPFTSKQDLRGAYPYGMAAVPLKKILRILKAVDSY